MTNKEKIENLFKTNGFITTDDIKKNEIPSSFMFEFIKDNKLKKLAPGFYASENWPIDEYFIIQYRFPKFIFSGMSALYLLGLTDRVVNEIEVTAPFGYHPNKREISNLIIHYERNLEKYNYDVIEVNTIFGNKVKVFGYEKTIADVITKRNDYDAETFLKAIKWYTRSENKNTSKLYKYAKLINKEKTIYDVMEIASDEN